MNSNLYATRLTTSAQKGQWMCFERNPIPGGVDLPLLVRKTKKLALAEGARFVAEKYDGSLFKPQYSVVGGHP